MAILLVHNVEHFIFSVYPTDSPEWVNILDKGVHTAVFSLFAGKAYAIFALLFGFTFFIQSDNQLRHGKDFGYRFLWRLVLLAVFGTLNAAFFPAGDVLQLFVVVGLVLFIVRKWSNKALLIGAAVMLLQPIEWYHYIASLINPAHQIPELGVSEMYSTVGEYVLAGNFMDFIWCNITLGQKASLLWAVNAGRFIQTAGLFMLGLYIGRKRLFVATSSTLRIWTTILIVSAVAFGPLYAFHELVMTGSDIVQQTVGTAFDMWQKLAFTFVLISSFVLLYQRKGFSDKVSALRFYGRMSLTNYVSQSIIGALIYFPFGLYLAQYCGAALSLAIGAVIFFAQVAFSRWWLSNHKQGPLETIWHRWTWIGTEHRSSAK